MDLEEFAAAATGGNAALIEPTSDKLWARLTSATPVERQRMLKALLEAQQLASDCFIGDHQHLIEELRRQRDATSATRSLLNQIIDERVTERLQGLADALLQR